MKKESKMVVGWNETWIRFQKLIQLVIGLILIGCAPAVSAESDRVFLGYYSGLPRNLPPSEINFEPFTHLCHAFLRGDAEGKALTRAGVPNRELTAEAHKHGVQVILSLGGWGSDDDFAAMCRNPGAPERHVREVIEIIEAYEYDGVDLDWEFPDTDEEVEGFARLTRGFRKALDELAEKKGQPYLLTMAVSARPSEARWLDSELLRENYDFLNVMTYDFYGGWSRVAGHHAPLYASSKDEQGGPRSVRAGMEYWVNEKHIPADRLAVGLPLYARGYEDVQPYGKRKDLAQGHFTRSYHQIPALIAQGWKTVRDEQTHASFLISPDGLTQIGYDDTESIGEKTRWAREHGYRGIFFWALGQDRLDDGRDVLIDAAAVAWPKTDP